MTEREATREPLDDPPDQCPHSRACGLAPHPHGPQCHVNCPTCHGGATPDGPQMIRADETESLPSLPQIGAATNRWRENHEPPLSTDPLHVIAKLAEEVGELARAVIAKIEHRPGRGDPVQEAAQVMIVVLSLIDILHGDSIDMLEEITAEMKRLGARL